MIRALTGITLLFLIACSNSERTDAYYKLSTDDSLEYEIRTPDCVLVVRQQTVKMNESALIKVLIYAPDKGFLLPDADLNLTVINKGRRKSIREINLKSPGVYEGSMNLNFSGLSTLEFEVTGKNFRCRELVDQEIAGN